MSKDRNFDDDANRMLAFLHLCEEDGHHALKVPLRSMDGCIPLDMADARSSGESLMIPVNEGAPAIWPIDLRFVQNSNAGVTDPADMWPEGSLQFNRLRTITAKEARPLGASIFSPRMVMDEVVIAKPDGTAKSAKAPLAQLGGKWQNAAPKAIHGYPAARAISVGLGLGLAVRYEWTVWVGHNDGPRIRFFSDPHGAREIFRLRDLPPGRERRAALRNWVSAHTRRKRDDEDAKVWVKKHLRGITDFTWNGLRCRINPPQFDLEQIAK